MIDWFSVLTNVVYATLCNDTSELFCHDHQYQLFIYDLDKKSVRAIVDNNQSNL